MNQYAGTMLTEGEAVSENDLVGVLGLSMHL